MYFIFPHFLLGFYPVMERKVWLRINAHPLLMSLFDRQDKQDNICITNAYFQMQNSHREQDAREAEHVRLWQSQE